MAASQRNGRLGGLAVAKKYNSDWRSARSEKAGLTVKARYGSAFFSHIAKLRKKKKVGQATIDARVPAQFREMLQAVEG